MTSSWVSPNVCTLPSDEQPLRVAEFDALFSTCLREVDRPSATTLRLILSGPGSLFDRVQDLADRETSCCSFFAFTVTAQPDSPAGHSRVRLDIEVPVERTDVLTAATQRAEAALRNRSST